MEIIFMDALPTLFNKLLERTIKVLTEQWLAQIKQLLDQHTLKEQVLYMQKKHAKNP